ncbi:hypothetical protein SAMN02745163_02838 [Clostridium cavendishii DSM 21758]|uniref:Uncharacterized protein n=1 Tax=Clostridium cavendishii DSM 21758 TaxID=1121302 RepID=A0A1M6N9T8_9CLOT|nr:hypothetical protein [Clostridium cavendishii]SHJ92488.1 hypothetical protein SAMN02745163_02838 [Clostridium cavendishii DSM 21758]
MKKSTAAFIGGLIGGFIKLLIDQVTFGAHTSNVDTVGTFSGFLFGRGTDVLTWIVYIIGVGVISLIISLLVSTEFIKNYFYSGLIIGVTWWGVMNIIFSISGITTPTWSMGIGSFIINLISHLVLGIVLTQTISTLHKMEVS